MIATQVKGIPGGGRAAAAERHSKKNWTKFALPPPPMKQLPAKESNLRKQQQQKSTVLISNSMQSSSSSSELQSTPGSKCCRSVDVVDSNCSSSSSFKTGKDYAIGARVSSSYLVSKNNKKKKSLHLKPGGGGRESSSSTVAVAKLYSIANSFSFQPPSPIPEEQVVDSEEGLVIHEATRNSSNSLQQLLVCTELEDEVLALCKQLEQEQELHTAMEKVLKLHDGHPPGSMPPLNNVPSHLPAAEQKLLLDIAILELEVLKLEMQMGELQWQLAHERSSEHESAVVVNELHSKAQVPSFQLPSIELQQEKVHLCPTIRPVVAHPLSSPVIPNINQLQSPQQSGGGQMSRHRVTLKELLHIPCAVAEEDDHLGPQLPLSSPPPPHDPSFSSAYNNRNCCSLEETLLCHQSTAISSNSPRLVPVQENEALTLSLNTTQGTTQYTTTPSPATSEKTRQLGLQLCVVSSQNTPDYWPELLPSPKYHSIWNILPHDDCSCSSCSSSSQRRCTSTDITNAAEQTSCSEPADSPSEVEKRRMYRSGIMRIRELRSQGLTGDSSEKSSVTTTTRSTTENLSRGTKEDASSRSESQTTADEDFGFRWTSEPINPNKLSEEMVRCMAKIFCHLGMPSNNARMLLQSNQSPTSHLGNQVIESSSLSSVSDSSSLSPPAFAHSPILGLQKQENNIMATDAATTTPSDLYKSRGKLSYADVGPYNHVLEVRWLSVSREQLKYAAQGLAKYRLLVERLQNVDPPKMSHKQKLAFWINIYNALLMHAFLAYGIPGSELKFFSLMRKAAYCVGGHWFNASVIESCILKGKAMAHRPQFGLMMALQKSKLKEELIKYGINRLEPLVNFALCCGAQFSPMVRVYSAEHVHEELRYAVHSYARAAVGISEKGKLMVPKLLYCYAHEIVEDRVLLDWVCNFLPSTQVAFIFECIQQHSHGHHVQSNNFAVVPFDFSFRYLFPSDICRSLR
ncbi:hypothetical protein CY35_04G065500 [Sphagnum magellanicum]|nr:hypothetical protein CY35_04G065500 [Sphagnum magellanicum]